MDATTTKIFSYLEMAKKKETEKVHDLLSTE